MNNILLLFPLITPNNLDDITSEESAKNISTFWQNILSLLWFPGKLLIEPLITTRFKYAYSKNVSTMYGDQTFYSNFVESFIKDTTEDIKKKINLDTNLQLFCTDLLAWLASIRNYLAELMNTKSASKFGDKRSVNSTSSLFTPLTAQYKEYGKKIIGNFSIIAPVKISSESKNYISYERFTIESIKLFAINEYAEFKKNLTDKKFEMSESYKKCKLIDILLTMKDRFEPLQKNSKDNSINWNNIKDIQFCTFFFKIREETIPLSSCAVIKSTSNFFNENYPILFHLDVHLMELVLEEVAILFEKAILSPSNDIEKLKIIMAELTYLYSHATPYERGSAAIGEWLEAIIYRYHKYEASYSKNVSMNLEALTSTFEDFMVYYHKNLILKPL